MFGVVLVGLAFVSVALYFLFYFMKNSQQVGPTEVRVMKNTFTGEVKEYRPGTHLVGPEMVAMTNIPLTIQETQLKDLEVDVARGVTMKLTLRLNWVAGRRTRSILGRTNGIETGFFEFDGSPPENAPIDSTMIRRAATKMDFEHVDDQIEEGLDYAFEQVFRSLTDEQLQDPRSSPPTLPTRDVEWMTAPRAVSSPEEMLDLLGEQIRILANQRLFNLGFGLTSVMISNLALASDRLKEARTKAREMELRAAAIVKAARDLRTGGVTIDPSVAALLDNPEALAKGMNAAALAKIAEALPQIHDLIHIENRP